MTGMLELWVAHLKLSHIHALSVWQINPFPGMQEHTWCSDPPVRESTEMAPVTALMAGKAQATQQALSLSQTLPHGETQTIFCVMFQLPDQQPTICCFGE